jgi:hypothetical protein
MKRISITGLMLVAALALSAVAVASASAHEWLIGGKAVAKATKITSEGTLELEDSKVIGGAVRVICTGKDEGTVGPGATDEITNITNAAGTSKTIICKFAKNAKGEEIRGACEAEAKFAPKAVAVNLPWVTTIETVEARTRDVIRAHAGGGEPGWSVTCKAGLLGEQVDTCTAPAGNTALAEVAGGVDATFDANSPKAKCTKGGAGAGSVTGTDLLKSPAEGKLGFN